MLMFLRSLWDIARKLLHAVVRSCCRFSFACYQWLYNGDECEKMETDFWGALTRHVKTKPHVVYTRADSNMNRRCGAVALHIQDADDAVNRFTWMNYSLLCQYLHSSQSVYFACGYRLMQHKILILCMTENWNSSKRWIWMKKRVFLCVTRRTCVHEWNMRGGV